MKTLTIEWLNKCRCGNKSHTVKTARGNETALWDDDAVKCNSCGRGGVIQVYEGQARVLWETDEEMAEGKPMSTITKEFTKEQLQQIEAAAKEVLWPVVWSEKKAREHFSEKITAKVVLKLARIALASLEAEPVAYTDAEELRFPHATSDMWPAPLGHGMDLPLYTAPPAPVAMKDHQIRELVNELRDIAVKYHGSQQLREHIARTIRAAMLQGAEQPQSAQQNIHENIPTLLDGLAAIRKSGIAIDGEKILAERDALNSPVIPDGWVMVPVELTPNMREAYHQAQAEYEDTDGLWCPDHQWQAMLAAAPQQEETAKPKK
ncbi:hypothetical protein [Enterobacter hormaechei]|uniref:hypothetical protein n=1 Tax=Enterobacter hormaechei TaxID=158836 RepID=UPI003BB97F8E